LQACKHNLRDINAKWLIPPQETLIPAEYSHVRKKQKKPGGERETNIHTEPSGSAPHEHRHVGFFSDLKRPEHFQDGEGSPEVTFKHGGLKWQT